MAELNVPTYEDTDEQAVKAGAAMVNYIMTGEVRNALFELKGLKVFGVIAALRENDEIFYGEGSTLNDQQRSRLAEIEQDVTESVKAKRHYYPFGHDKSVDVNKEAEREVGFLPYSSVDFFAGRPHKR